MARVPSIMAFTVQEAPRLESWSAAEEGHALGCFSNVDLPMWKGPKPLHVHQARDGVPTHTRAPQPLFSTREVM